MQLKENIKNKPFEISGNWEILSKRLKQNFPYLTDTDLRFEPGKEHELLRRVKSRLYMTREEVMDLIEKHQTLTPTINEIKIQEPLYINKDSILPTITQSIVYRKDPKLALLKKVPLVSLFL